MAASNHVDEHQGSMAIIAIILWCVLLQFKDNHPDSTESRSQQVENIKNYQASLFKQLETDKSLSVAVGQVYSHTNDGKKSVIKLDSGRFIGISPIFHVDAGVEVRKASGGLVEKVFGPDTVFYCFNGEALHCYREIFVEDIKNKPPQS